MPPAEAVDFELIFEALLSPHLALAPDLTIVAANGGMCRLLQRTRAELLGQPAESLFEQHPLAAQPATLAAWQQLLHDAAHPPHTRTISLQHDLTLGNGTQVPRHWQVQLRPVVDAQHALRYLLCRVLDVTDRVLAEQRGSLSREGFGLLAQATHDAVWDADLRTGTVWRNPVFSTLFGYPPDVDCQAPLFWHERVHPDDQERVDTEQRRAIASPAPVFSISYRFRRGDGTWADVIDRAYVLRDDQGVAIRLLGAMQDVTRQHAAEQLARQNAIRFQHLTEVQQQLVWTTRPDGYVEYVNPYWERFMNLTLAEAQQEEWTHNIHPDDFRSIQERRQAIRQTGEILDAELRLRDRTTGGYRWFQSRVVPVRDAQGTIVQWVGTATDIHERRQALALLQEKDRQLQNIIGNVPAYIITMFGPDLTVGFVNEHLQQLLGGRVRVGGPVAESLPELIADGLTERLGQVYATGQAYSALEVLSPVIRAADQPPEYRYFDFTYQPLYDEHGTTRGIMMFAIDATDRVQARLRADELHAEVRRRDEQFRFLAESIPQIVWTAQPDGRVDYYNQRWADYTGLGTEESVYGHTGQLVLPEDLERARHRYQLSMQTGIDYEEESRLRGRDGQYRWFLHRAQPMRDADGRILRWFGTSTDIDDFKQAQQRLEQQNATLTLTNQDLDSFVYTASHDLKQPIDNMAGIFAELTRTAYFRDPDSIKLIAMFERSLQQIFDTIHNLSELVQVQKLRHHLPAETVLLEPLVREVLTGMSEQLDTLRAVLTLDFRALPAVVFVRPNLQSVLYNLLSNALKYAAPRRQPVISVRSYLEDGQPVLEVQDNGMGIDLERYGAQLFTMFRRFHSHVEGSGMGLYLVNRLVQSHGGRVEVRSVVNEGTAFRIYLTPAALPTQS